MPRSTSSRDDLTLARGDGLSPDDRDAGDHDGDDRAARNNLQGVDDPTGPLVRAADHRQRDACSSTHAAACPAGRVSHLIEAPHRPREAASGPFRRFRYEAPAPFVGIVNPASSRVAMIHAGTGRERSSCKVTVTMSPRANRLELLGRMAVLESRTPPSDPVSTRQPAAFTAWSSSMPVGVGCVAEAVASMTTCVVCTTSPDAVPLGTRLRTSTLLPSRSTSRSSGASTLPYRLDARRPRQHRTGHDEHQANAEGGDEHLAGPIKEQPAGQQQQASNPQDERRGAHGEQVGAMHAPLDLGRVIEGRHATSVAPHPDTTTPAPASCRGGRRGSDVCDRNTHRGEGRPSCMTDSISAPPPAAPVIGWDLAARAPLRAQVTAHQSGSLITATSVRHRLVGL